MQALRDLWTGAGLEAVETREITVHRTFADFDDFWMTEITSPAVAPVVATMASGDAEKLKSRVRAPACRHRRTDHLRRACACDQGSSAGGNLVRSESTGVGFVMSTPIESDVAPLTVILTLRRQSTNP